MTVVGVQDARVGSLRVVKTRVAVVISCDLSPSVANSDLIWPVAALCSEDWDEFDEEDE